MKCHKYYIIETVITSSIDYSEIQNNMAQNKQFRDSQNIQISDRETSEFSGAHNVASNCLSGKQVL